MCIRDRYVYTVSVWQDGLAACAMLAEQGVPTAVEQWEAIVDTTAEASDRKSVCRERVCLDV